MPVHAPQVPRAAAPVARSGGGDAGGGGGAPSGVAANVKKTSLTGEPDREAEATARGAASGGVTFQSGGSGGAAQGQQRASPANECDAATEQQQQQLLQQLQQAQVQQQLQQGTVGNATARAPPAATARGKSKSQFGAGRGRGKTQFVAFDSTRLNPNGGGSGGGGGSGAAQGHAVASEKNKGPVAEKNKTPGHAAKATWKKTAGGRVCKTPAAHPRPAAMVAFHLSIAAQGLAPVDGGGLPDADAEARPHAMCFIQLAHLNSLNSCKLLNSLNSTQLTVQSQSLLVGR